jgi:uncharacterized protein (DUF305 family)
MLRFSRFAEARSAVSAALAMCVLAACAGDPAPVAKTDSTAVASAEMSHDHMAGMAGHEMRGLDAPVVIPKGAIFNEADVRFMQGMIAHHAQAVYMSQLATTRGSDPKFIKLTVKIDQSQVSEITQMEGWLRANGQWVPDSAAYKSIFMTGMLTADELKKLEGLSGPEFDTTYLEFMIKHHEGAILMVKELLATPGAAQDVDVGVFANDVEAVQTAEIGTMQSMLATYRK